MYGWKDKKMTPDVRKMFLLMSWLGVILRIGILVFCTLYFSIIVNILHIIRHDFLTFVNCWRERKRKLGEGFRSWMVILFLGATSEFGFLAILNNRLQPSCLCFKICYNNRTHHAQIQKHPKPNLYFLCYFDHNIQGE